MIFISDPFFFLWQTVFESVWNFESYSHVKSNISFLKVVKQVDEHRRVLHVQFPYRGNLLRPFMPARVALVEATWRQDCDGTFVILFSSHHQVNQYAKTTGGLVPARMNAAVTIAPLKPDFRLKNNYSHESLMTVVMRFEPGGWFETGSIPRIIINADSFFLQSMVDWFISIRERTEQERSLFFFFRAFFFVESCLTIFSSRPQVCLEASQHRCDERRRGDCCEQSGAIGEESDQHSTADIHQPKAKQRRRVWYTNKEPAAGAQPICRRLELRPGHQSKPNRKRFFFPTKNLTP